MYKVVYKRIQYICRMSLIDNSFEHQDSIVASFIRMYPFHMKTEMTLSTKWYSHRVHLCVEFHVMDHRLILASRKLHMFTLL